MDLLLIRQQTVTNKATVAPSNNVWGRWRSANKVLFLTVLGISHKMLKIYQISSIKSLQYASRKKINYLHKKFLWQGKAAVVTWAEIEQRAASSSVFSWSFFRRLEGFPQLQMSWLNKTVLFMSSKRKKTLVLLFNKITLFSSVKLVLTRILDAYFSINDWSPAKALWSYPRSFLFSLKENADMPY